MKSLWTEKAEMPHYKKLRGEKKTDVLVIGGGMAGLLCAYMLKRAGVRCILVEAQQLCSGITGGTTAKLTSQHGLIYDRLVNTFGVEKAQLYYMANEAAIAEYRRLCRTIDCGFEDKAAYLYSTHDRAALEQEMEALERMHCRAQFAEQAPMPLRTVGSVCFPNQAQFHPLRFAAALTDGLEIYENTQVTHVSGSTAITDDGKIIAQSIIVATHFPFINRHGSYFMKLYQERAGVVAMSGAPQVDGMFADISSDGLSLRTAEGLLLLSGGSKRTGKSGGGLPLLERTARRLFPQGEVRFRWAAQDCITLDGMPYIGQYSRRTPGLYVATGFNKWGMTSSMTAALLLTDLVMGRRNEYAALFSPSRSMLHPQLALNAAETTLNLLRPFPKRCSHLGCALKWNAAEHTWDCPCHGSRFSEEGEVIDNPAEKRLKH
ncbi:MAG: FAD-dependent oxidoreductase [Ruminococcaceae bacterium]|nr:FAD-dependent oxidoreductase [Oscillospiraceae bacterium]